MKTWALTTTSAALVVCATLALVLAPVSASTLGENVNVKTQAILAAPDGATNTAAKGKAKASYKDNGQNLLQTLNVTLQKLERRTEYRIVIDGLELGVFSPRGNSGTLKLKFRTPAKGNQDEVPAELGETRNFVLIEVFNAETGELALSGTFVPLPEE